jgi:hypothetical protein
MRRFLIVLAFVVACGGGQSSAPSTVVANDHPADPAAGECAAIAPTLAKTYKARPNLEAGKLDRTISSRCLDDDWNKALRACLKTSASDRDSSRCKHEHMTRDQAKKLDAALEPDVVSGAAEAMAAMRDFTDKMCACKDPACAQRVSDEMTRWSQDMSRRETEPPRMSEKDMQEAASIGEHMGRCMQAAMSASAPTP